MLAAIRKNLPEIHPVFIKDEGESRGLNDLERRGRHHRARDSVGKAVLGRPATSLAGCTFVEDRRRCGLKRNVRTLGPEPAQTVGKLIAGHWSILAFSADPDSREVRLAVGRT